MFSKEMEALIEVTLQDGVITEKEKAVLVKRAQKEGFDEEELDVYIDSILKKRQHVGTEGKTAANNIEAVETGGSWEKLQQKLESMKPRRTLGMNLDTGLGKRKDEMIINFPVPNTRVGLLEFLSSLQPKAKNKKRPIFETDDAAEMASPWAYWQLYCNCINKAKISYANDPSFKNFFDFYEQESNAKKGGVFSKMFGW